MIALFAALLLLSPNAGKAASGLNAWWQMLEVCEAVIAKQSDGPLIAFAPAPFSFGKPGVKQYSVYDPSGNLVVKAVQKGETWIECQVGEHKGSGPETHVGDPVQDWAEAFPARFPSSKYAQAEFRFLVPGRMNPIAVRCEGAVLPYNISAHWALVAFSGGKIELDALKVRLDDGDICAPKEQSGVLGDTKRVAGPRVPGLTRDLWPDGEAPDQVRGAALFKRHQSTEFSETTCVGRDHC